MEIKENVLLANYTTFRIGGEARWFCEAKNIDEIKEAVLWAKEKNVPYFILGGGSNLLVSDNGFDGLVIKVISGQWSVVGDSIKADAGVPLIKVIMETTKNGYSGLEWGFGIPGTIGGAVCGNAHRLGQAMAQVVESVEILDENLESKILNKEECEFIYGGSRFKKSGEIILSANLVFKKAEQNKIDEVLVKAKEVVRCHAPYPSAGCVFRNYETQGEDDKLLKNHQELMSRVREGKLGVGYLIDQCGLKEKQIGGAKIWGGHANYIVNAAGAKATDVIELINLCKEKVKEKYNIELEEEIRYLGFEV